MYARMRQWSKHWQPWVGSRWGSTRSVGVTDFLSHPFAMSHDTRRKKASAQNVGQLVVEPRVWVTTTPHRIGARCHVTQQEVWMVPATRITEGSTFSGKSTPALSEAKLYPHHDQSFQKSEGHQIEHRRASQTCYCIKLPCVTQSSSKK